MNKRNLLFVALLLSLATVAPSTAEVTAQYGLGLNSIYVWRGIVLTDGPSAQPSATISHSSGFSANFWGSIDLDDVNGNTGNFTELDITLSYGQTVGNLNWSVGYVHYTFPNTSFNGTKEVFGSIGLNVLLSPTLIVYYDFEEVDDLYANFGISYGGSFTDAWGWSLAASAGWAGSNWAQAVGGSDGGFFDGNASLSISYSADNWSLGFLGAYTDTLDEDALPTQPTQWWGGISGSISF